VTLTDSINTSFELIKVNEVTSTNMVLGFTTDVLLLVIFGLRPDHIYTWQLDRQMIFG